MIIRPPLLCGLLVIAVVGCAGSKHCYQTETLTGSAATCAILAEAGDTDVAATAAKLTTPSQGVYNFAFTRKKGEERDSESFARMTGLAFRPLFSVSNEEAFGDTASRKGRIEALGIAEGGGEIDWMSAAPDQVTQQGVLGELVQDCRGQTHRWDVAYCLVNQQIKNVAVRPSSESATHGLLLAAVEPSYGFSDERYLKKVIALQEEEEKESKVPGTATSSSSDDPKTGIKARTSPIWPGSGVSWHLGRDYSELSEAQKELKEAKEATFGTPQVKVAHLDTGYFHEDALRPSPNLLENESLSFVKGVGPTAEVGGRHGSRTLSTLAGSVANVDDPKIGSFSGTIGGYPDMQVAEYRIAKRSFIHLIPTAMANAIHEAATKEYDVVTISAGGLPSMLQKSAVNYAYDHGTAVFAASGDFFVVPVFGYSTPKTLVFPARYNRVMGVVGVTADGRSYGKAPCRLCLLKFWRWGSWGLRGSYGPASEMAGHTIAAYAPNITHSVGTDSNPNEISLNGAGTSHATPQAAAAAAMWLEYNYDRFSDDSWRTWVKTEAVYQALMRSANTCGAGYTVETMGEGTLRAQKALTEEFDLGSLTARDPSTIGLTWIWDWVNSTELLKPYDARLRASLAEMLFTEIQQVIYRSREIEKVLEAVADNDDSADNAVAKEDGRCETKRIRATGNTSHIRKVIALIMREDISNELREALQRKLDSISKG